MSGQHRKPQRFVDDSTTGDDMAEIEEMIDMFIYVDQTIQLALKPLLERIEVLERG